jgi:hypothetical protein
MGMKQEDPSYKIIPSNTLEYRAVAVYYGYNFLVNKEYKNAQIEIREPDYNTIPNYGHLLIRIQDITAATANPKDWLFIVLDGNDKEIYRDYGLNLLPHAELDRYGAIWYSYHSIFFEEEIKFPLYLRVINPNKEQIDIAIK